MTDDRARRRGPTPSALSRVTLGVVWLFASLTVATLGWFLFALSEDGADRGAGLVLLAVALFGVVTAAALVNRPARRLAIASSAAFVVGGLVALVIVAVGGDAFAGDLLLLGGIPVVAGVVTWLLAVRSG